MPYVIKAGAKTIGFLKRKSKKKINEILAREVTRKTKVSIIKVATVKKRKK